MSGRTNGAKRSSRRFSWAKRQQQEQPPIIDMDLEPSERVIRVTVVGDGFTGKTCLLIAYKDKKYDDVYIPTVFDSYSMNISVYDKMYKLILQDTAGQEDYDRLRPLGYATTDVFIVCYSIDREDSYKNVQSKWAREVRHFRPKCKIILVGTKVDMRDGRTRSLTFDDGLRLQSDIHAEDFYECSAKELYNVDNVFSAALIAAVKKPKMKKRHQFQCTLL